MKRDDDRADLKKITAANREAWDEVMPLHRRAAGEKWDRAFAEPGFSCLRENERDLFVELGIRGAAVAHLSCNNGIELLSIRNLGAGECVGFDISQPAIREARERAAKVGIDCRFVRTDVYEIDSEFEDRFDLAYFSSGALGWLPDLKLLFARVARMLRDGGRVFIHEIHPVSEMLPWDGEGHEDPLRIVEPYFRTEPHVEYGGLDYVGGAEYESDKPQYWFVHKLSDIIMALVENGIAVERFVEYEADISAGHRCVEEAKAGVPLSYVLIGRKG